MVNLPYLWQRNTLLLAASLFSFRFVLLAIALIVPAFLGAIQGYRPLQTGRVMLWNGGPQLVVVISTECRMKCIDSRLILGAGFALVAVGCLMNASLTSAWAANDFWTSQLVLGIGLSVTFVAMVGGIVQQAALSGAISNPFDALTYAAFFHSVRLLGASSGSPSCRDSFRCASNFTRI